MYTLKTLNRHASYLGLNMKTKVWVERQKSEKKYFYILKCIITEGKTPNLNSVGKTWVLTHTRTPREMFFYLDAAINAQQFTAN